MSLRQEALGGARYLILREAVGIVVRLGGVLVLTRIIGPAEYGLFASAWLTVQFCAVLATYGSDMFLIRRPGEVETAWYHQTFSFLLLSGVLLAAVGIVGAGALTDLVDDPRLIAPLQVLLLSIPINILWVPAKAILERRFDYRRLTICELGADTVQYAVAIPLALGGLGLWAAVIGFLVRQAFMLVSSYWLARYRPRWRWDRAMARELLAYGGGISGSTMLTRARDLVLAFVIGRYLGAAAVGIAVLATRLVEAAAFVNRVADRVSLVALARLQAEPLRLRAAVEKGTLLKVFAAAPVLVALSGLSAYVLPVLLGPEWVAIGSFVPFVALNSLVSALFSTQSATLMALGRRWTIFLTNAVALAIYVAGALLLVPLIGLPGLPLAGTISLIAPWVRNLELRRSHGVRYGRAVPWFVAALPLLFVALIPWWGVALSVLPTVLLLLLPRYRADLVQSLQILRKQRPVV
jgi:O-antigen/teichoic acid export membrane protein